MSFANHDQYINKRPIDKYTTRQEIWVYNHKLAVTKETFFFFIIAFFVKRVPHQCFKEWDMLPLPHQISTHRKLDKTNWTERVKFLEDLWKKWNRFAFRNIILHCGKKDTYYLKTGKLFYQLFGKCLYVWIFKRNRRHFFCFPLRWQKIAQALLIFCEVYNTRELEYFFATIPLTRNSNDPGLEIVQ